MTTLVVGKLVSLTPPECTDYSAVHIYKDAAGIFILKAFTRFSG